MKMYPKSSFNTPSLHCGSKIQKHLNILDVLGLLCVGSETAVLLTSAEHTART